MDNEENRMNLNNSFRNTQKQINKKKHICLYPNCDKIAVSSHSQQRNRSLLSIAGKNNKVYVLNADLGHSYDFKTDEFKILYKLTGIGLASTFKGFCEEHESIFKLFEDNGLNIKEKEHIYYLHYRTLMYGYSKIRKEIERANQDNEQSIKTYSNIDTESINKNRVNNLKQVLANQKSESDIVIKHIENKDEDFLSWISIEIPMNIGISSSFSSVLSDYDSNGHNPTFTFNILPDINSTIIIIAWLRIYNNQAKGIVDLENKDFEYLVNKFAFYLSEDICINPELFDSNIDIQNAVKEIGHLIDPLFFEKNPIKNIIKIIEYDIVKEL